MPSEIILLHVQSKLSMSKAAMQGLHGVWQNYVKFFRLFRRVVTAVSYFCRKASDCASAKCCGPVRGRAGKALADVRFSC